MRKMNITLAALLMAAATATAQGVSVKSYIKGTDNQPVEGAIITVRGGASVVTDKNGAFEIKAADDKSVVLIKAPGYYEMELPVSFFVRQAAKGDFVITVIPTTEMKYNGYVNTPMATQTVYDKSVTTQGLEAKDFSGKLSVGAAIGNNVAGLQVIEKSGMPGEGTFMNIRGIHSLAGENSPLLVINGVPYFSNVDVSAVINGYSRDVLAGYSPKDIRSVTVLKGAEAAQWGVLGSNGVIMIETQQANSDNLDTRITFSGQYGFNVKQSAIPVLDASQYRAYMKDLGLTLYPSMSALTNDYPFLQNAASYTGDYLFNENNNWMDEIQRTGFVTDNQLRVEGGDEIAKYNISFGYTKNDGVLRNTSSDRYHTLISADVLASRQIDIFTNISLSYINSDLLNTGTASAYNPIISAYRNMPLVSAFKKQTDGQTLLDYARYNEWNTSSTPMYAYDNVSNPLALVNNVEGDDKIYDANASLGINYRITDHLTLTGLVNLYYNYTEENMFVPGVTDQAIIPQYYGYGDNYRAGSVIRQMTNAYSVSADYKRTFNNIHDLNVKATARFMQHSIETDIADGYNTANDYFKSLNYLVDELRTYGGNNEWNYMSYALHGTYTWNKMLRASAGFNLDATSASGADASRLGFFPSAGLTFMAANTGALPSEINLLNITLEGSYSGNARFSSNYGKDYYTAANLFSLGGIARANMPNTKLSWETTRQIDFGFEAAAFDNRISLGFNYYFANSYDLLFNSNISSVYGSGIYYDNVGEINNSGIELSLRVNPIHNRDWDFVAGVTLATNKSTLKDLGGAEKSVISFTGYGNDDAQVVMQVGSNPYEFYGYKTAGVYATTEQAQAAGLTNAAGISYQAGDVIFVDQNNDGVINDADKTAIGCASPDVFGAFNLALRYRQFTLDANFGYSIGNDAYNYTRRLLESQSAFYNQSTSVLNRWQVEGQVTDMPRANYGDNIGNNSFSDRWIEDASYFKLRSLKFSYNFGKIFGFVNSGNVWVAAENLFTLTKYLGSDPEFAYGYTAAMRGFDYSKVSLPRTFKVGFDLNF